MTIGSGRRIALSVAAIAALGASQAAFADHGVPKWEQPPQWGPAPSNVYLGWNEVSWSRLGPPEVGPIVADDWKCTTTDPVTDVHWWGSYLGWNGQDAPGRPLYFHITIWTDVPQGMDKPWSHPGTVIWEYDCYDYTETFVGYDYDPRGNLLESCFYYECFLPQSAWFYQEPGENIYWVSIAAVFDCLCDGDLNGDGVIDNNDIAWFFNNCPPGSAPSGVCQKADLNCDGLIDPLDEQILNCLVATGGDQAACCERTDPLYLWGWKTKPRDDASPAPDAAVIIGIPTDAHVGMSYIDGWPITWPGEYSADQWDMAFELTAQSVGNQYKVYEPPVFSPQSPYPDCYWGWDELSLHGGPQIGAADWICVEPTPVSDIHWWGSYQGWDDPSVLPPIVPSGWVFTIWDNSATGTPNQVIWQRYASAREVTETVVGCDYHPDHGYDTTFYYQYDIPQADWFYQPDGQNVYWISISPIYDDVQPCECNADFNGDGMIDGFDWNFLQSCWGPVMPGCEQADLNCDGFVDAIDAGIFDCQAAAGWPDPACCDQLQNPYPWGWKTKPFAQTGQPNPGAVITDPTAPVVGSIMLNGYMLTDFAGEPWDYAFALTTTSGGTVEPYVKWSQPPEPWQGDVIYGWDELSLWGGNQIAADDWVCTTRDPVTDLHWWGSFLNWTLSEPPQLPDRFRVVIARDVPAGVDRPYSHPGAVVHEFAIVDYAWTFVGFDFDPCGEHGPDACFRFDCILPEDAWFQQPADEAILWISISAEYDVAVPQHPFGWKTRPRDPFSPAPDAAVRIFNPTAPSPGQVISDMYPLICNDQPFDLSFVITTCDVCGDMNGDGITDTYDIDAFVLALSDPTAYAIKYPGVPISNGDCNGDGSVDTYDIDAFVYALLHMGCMP